METNEKLEQIAEVLDQDAGSLRPETLLSDIGWDSMGMLSVIALAKQNGKTITGAQVREFLKVGDILENAF